MEKQVSSFRVLINANLRKTKRAPGNEAREELELMRADTDRAAQ